VDRELRQVDVVEAVALGERASELVLGDRARLEEDLLRRLPGMPGGLDGVLGRLLLDEAKLDQDVRQEAPAGAAERGRGDPGPRERRAASRARDLAGEGVGAHAGPFAGEVPSGVPLRRAGADCAEISASSRACCGESASASRWMP